MTDALLDGLLDAFYLLAVTANDSDVNSLVRDEALCTARAAILAEFAKLEAERDELRLRCRLSTDHAATGTREGT